MEGEHMKIALAGNPNSGKTSLFNYLTGSRQHVGNWPGVTVEKKEGVISIGDKQHMLIDLPGIYTLDPDTIEQRLTRDFIFKQKPDLIINILDASNLQRNLYFTLQLRESGIPMIVTLNMMDEVEKSGTVIDKDNLSKILGVPVVGISASKGVGIENLLSEITQFNDKKVSFAPFCLGCKDCSKCKSGEFRYAFIDSIISKCVQNGNKTDKNDTASAKIDKFALNKYLAFPIFLIIMLIVFSLTFGTWMSKLSDAINYLLNGVFSSLVLSGLTTIHSPSLLISLICDGIIPGIGTVLTFLPQIALLFILMSLLEDSGYMARAAILMDRVFAAFGLSGSSFIPMIMGFGCMVPAVMSCRILPNEKDRKLTILLTSFMSCSARLPLYALMTGVFFVQYRSIVIFSIYLLGIVVAIVAALILNKTLLKNAGTSFVMEVPPYRLPNPRNLVLHTWEKVKGFIIKAGTVIFGASVVIWFLQSFTIYFQSTASPTKSIIADIGRLIAPIFAPLGFGNWQSSTALLTGVAAKELVVSTFSVISTTAGNAGGLHAAIGTLFTPLSAFAFMCFVLLYSPCVSAITTMKHEFNSWKWTIGTLALDFSVAWFAAFIIYNGGRLIGF
jgi:ferrous iron transport protein B